MIQKEIIRTTRPVQSFIFLSSHFLAGIPRRQYHFHYRQFSQYTAITSSKVPFRLRITVPKNAQISTSRSLRAQPANADALLDDMNELYATARDEFEIAAEETEKKTVYAADDREAAQEAFQTLKDAYEKAVHESSPEVAKEVQGRVGQRIRELEHAMKAMEESAKED